MLRHPQILNPAETAVSLAFYPPETNPLYFAFDFGDVDVMIVEIAVDEPIGFLAIRLEVRVGEHLYEPFQVFLGGF
jgi:hypothetical protein